MFFHANLISQMTKRIINLIVQVINYKSGVGELGVGRDLNLLLNSRNLLFREDRGGFTVLRNSWDVSHFLGRAVFQS